MNNDCAGCEWELNEKYFTMCECTDNRTCNGCDNNCPAPCEVCGQEFFMPGSVVYLSED